MHICTRPVFVKYAEPGDILEVRIVDVNHRPCANPAFKGKSFGINAAAWWGFHYNDLIEELGPEAQSQIYSKSSVDLTMRDAFRKVRHFLMTTQGLSEDEAISLDSGRGLRHHPGRGWQLGCAWHRQEGAVRRAQQFLSDCGGMKKGRLWAPFFLTHVNFAICVSVPWRARE